ncbi:PREDICTED: endogenous retrovirus group K member 18 Pol protein-like [Lepidothrix coronata]|uniref:Endogenous retrovirus group K member 18 Pol protein-like n=1 Tax=Lepidothrix coronata TaxID=321398 RepID=A0A6J0H1G3_9PASS|nr:PREDICTED: endogenous retrovirus group K member 18 Pol protein-like [Lepidothrix coronata]
MVSMEDLLCVLSTDEEQRREQKEVLWTTTVKSSRPLLKCLVYYSQPRQPQQVKVEGLLDTGADITIIASKDWPHGWPAQTAYVQVSGLGGTQYPVRSGVTEVLQLPRLSWKTETPVWVDQWPLPKKKLQILNDLVSQELAKGHLEPSTSPWNTPVFVIQKSSGSWRFLQDLRKVNEVLEPMGALQQGMPSPSMLPAEWPLVVIDIKDCFFHIFLNPADSARFAFSVPAINACEPHRRFQWRVLPQGMKNSPTLCQMFVAEVLRPIRQKYPQSIIFHYIDDVLICANSQLAVEKTLNSTISALKEKGLEISPEKVQREAPWRYLGLQITGRVIRPQAIEIDKRVHTLNNLQKLLGAINWIRPVLGITTGDLHPLFELLKGDADLSSPRYLTSEAEAALSTVEKKITQRQSCRRMEGLPSSLVIIREQRQPLALLGQFSDDGKDFCLWEWVFLPHQFGKTITTVSEMIGKIIFQVRTRCLELSGEEPDFIYLPLTSEHLEQLLQTSTDFQIAIGGYPGEIWLHLPACPFIQRLIQIPLKLKIIQSDLPIKGAKTIFTNGSGRTGNEVIIWQQNGDWQQDIHKVQGSPQIVELSAVVRAFEIFSGEPINIVTDSAYVCGVVKQIENSYLKEVANQDLFKLLTKLLFLIHNREFGFFIVHTRSHTTLPGPVAEGNQIADHLAGMVVTPNLFQQAKISHEFFHQNARSLQKQFGLKLSQAKEILRTCLDCQVITPIVPEGTNPRDLSALEIWQSDVTHVPEFGKLKYVHMSIDTFSKMIVATTHSGEKSRDVKKHFLSAFARMGVPKQVKTDNGPSYVSADTKRFFEQWGVHHTTGIPHNPTGQGIVERAHQNIKNLLKKQKRGSIGLSPQEKLDKVMYVLNFLNMLEEAETHTNRSPADRHFKSDSISSTTVRVKVMYRDPLTETWTGPFPLITWGKGYACVAGPEGPKWVPARRVKIHQA